MNESEKVLQFTGQTTEDIRFWETDNTSVRSLLLKSTAMKEKCALDVKDQHIYIYIYIYMYNKQKETANCMIFKLHR